MLEMGESLNIVNLVIEKILTNKISNNIIYQNLTTKN
jgi:hypothetical protein